MLFLLLISLMPNHIARI